MKLSTVLKRSVRLRCPQCGGGRLFAGLLKMYPLCSNCQFKYERDPGYFLGSAYINYGITAISLTVMYVSLHFGAGYSNRQLTPFLLTFCIAFPLLFFRYARAFWLGMDCYFDVEQKDSAPPAQP